MEHGKRENVQETRPRRERKKRKSTKIGLGRRLLFWLGTLILVGVCTAAMLAVIFLKYVDTTLAPTLQVDADDYTMELSSFVYYQDKDTGNWQEYQSIYGEKNRVLVDIEDMAPALWQAAVAIEDQRFFEHEGVDWKRTAGATVNMFLSMRDTFGGSTITQQMLKNMTEDNDATVNRKVREIFRALEFEKNYTKKEILELYLNFVFFGQGCYGVQSAAQHYFGKDAKDLTVAESASLIAITNNPSMYGPLHDITITREDGSTVTPRELNKIRQERIIDKMCDAGNEGIVGPKTLEEMNGDPDDWGAYLTPSEAAEAKREILQFADGSTSLGKAEEGQAVEEEGPDLSRVNSWFVDYLLDEVSEDLGELWGVESEVARVRIYNQGLHIYSTLDPEIQELAESVYENRSNLDVTSADGQKIQSGITIIEPSTGNIKAMVGAIGIKEGNRLTNYATMQRQPGSSMKPLTAYAPALDTGAVTPASVFDNYPVRELNGSPWPKNSPPGYGGLTTLRTGIVSSINTIAVQSLEKGGVTNAYTFATEKLNLDLAPEDMDVSPLAMGGLTYGLSTVEMAAAYASFANGGIYNAPKSYVRVTDADGNILLENTGEQHVAMKDTTAYFINSFLTAAVNEGTGGSAKFPGMTIAGKTGTTNDNYARYFVGYTPYYCAAVWTGYQYNAKVRYNGNPAITMWKKVMQPLHADLPNQSFAKPATGLTSVTVCRDSGMLASETCAADPRGGRTWTVEVAAGTAPTETCTMHQMVDFCTEGECLAGEFCPESSVQQRAYLNHTRADYGGLVADDNIYLLSTWQKQLEELGGICPAHSTAAPPPAEDLEPGAEMTDPLAPLDPNDPDAPFLENDPNYPGNQQRPDESVTLPAPAPTDPAGGQSGDAWWSNMWNN